MDIDLNSPDIEHPMVNVHEYRGVLLDQQTVNHAEVHKYLGSVDTQPEKVGEMLDTMFHQPAMESVYRLNGIEPNQVEAFIGKVQKLPLSEKKPLITEFYIAYASAAGAVDGFVDGISTISNKKEWDVLPKHLKEHPNLKHLERKAENIKNQEKALQKEEKTGLGKKIKSWFEKKKISTKGIKNIAAGVVAAVVLTPAAMKLLNLTADKDNAKLAKSEQKAPQQSKQDMSKVYDMNNNVRS